MLKSEGQFCVPRFVFKI